MIEARIDGNVLGDLCGEDTRAEQPLGGAARRCRRTKKEGQS